MTKTYSTNVFRKRVWAPRPRAARQLFVREDSPPPSDMWYIHAAMNDLGRESRREQEPQ